MSGNPEYVYVSGHEHDEWNHRTPNYLLEETEQMMNHEMRLTVWRFGAVMWRGYKR